VLPALDGPHRDSGMPNGSTSLFTDRTLGFFRGLAKNNNKPWFEEHRTEYEESVRAPMRELIEEMDVRLAGICPEVVGDSKRSMFRIHRDVRFSKDKSPYKTHAACWFYHRAATRGVGGDAHGGSAGFYFHIEPGSSMVGGGLWMPPRPALKLLRDAIAEDPRGFARIARDKTLVRRYGGLDNEAVLKRMPRGFAEDHPASEWLRYQSFTAGRTLSDVQVTSRKLPSLLEEDFSRILPLVRWLNNALGLRPAAGR
jgi:uncharacterized protein (TIGR02453 family)